MFENSVEPSETSSETNKNKIVSPASDIERVLTTLRQIVRDWTTQGTEERNSSYGLILKELKNRFPNVKRSETFFYFVYIAKILLFLLFDQI